MVYGPKVTTGSEPPVTPTKPVTGHRPGEAQERDGDAAVGPRKRLFEQGASRRGLFLLFGPVLFTRSDFLF